MSYKIRKDILNSAMTINRFIALSIILFMSGCTSLPRHTPSDSWKTRFPNIVLTTENIDVKSAKPSGEYKNYQNDFIENFKTLTANDDITIQGEPLPLRVRLKYDGGISTFGQYIMMAVTTPLVFLVFNSNRHSVPYTIDYTLSDSDNNVTVMHNRFKGKINGAFRGWSFMRWFSRSRLFEEQGKFFAKEAAVLVFNDIANTWMKGDKSVSASSESDFRLRRRKIMRIEQLLREAKKIYPSGVELPPLRKRLEKAKERFY